MEPNKVKETQEKPKKAFPAGAGPGRPKGLPNKNTRLLKDMIMQALDKAGGVTYLCKQAKENPKAFLTLVGRVLPMQVTGEDGAGLVVIVKDYTGRKKADDATD